MQENIVLSIDSTIYIPSHTSLYKEYDAFISLGRNCHAATSLRYRGLLPYALPFDFLLNPYTTHMQSIIECFLTAFNNFFLYENLLQLSKEEHLCRQAVQYKDVATNFFWIHHFEKIKEYDYKRVRQALDKKIDRLYFLLHNAHNILFITDNTVNIWLPQLSPIDFGLSEEILPPPLEDTKKLHQTLSSLFPSTNIDILLIHFNPQNKEISKNKKISITLISEHITLVTAYYNILQNGSFFNQLYNIEHFPMYNGFRLSDYGSYLPHLYTQNQNLHRLYSSVIRKGVVDNILNHPILNI